MEAGYRSTTGERFYHPGLLHILNDFVDDIKLNKVYLMLSAVIETRVCIFFREQHAGWRERYEAARHFS